MKKNSFERLLVCVSSRLATICAPGSRKKQWLTGRLCFAFHLQTVLLFKDSSELSKL
jgi:hypothetical protein